MAVQGEEIGASTPGLRGRQRRGRGWQALCGRAVRPGLKLETSVLRLGLGGQGLLKCAAAVACSACLQLVMCQVLANQYASPCAFPVSSNAGSRLHSRRRTSSLCCVETLEPR